MNCSFYELRHKEVINRTNGCRIGFVDDLDIDVECARINALIIYGGFRLFGFFGKKNDYIIPWKNIGVVGEDTILVDWNVPKPPSNRIFGNRKYKRK
ncbi:MAG: YlmC/YmxH family sporulation protein [Ruminococcus sp.]|nr:YlmC/YmxH family sporulation protein [Ruminococcus sp.]